MTPIRAVVVGIASLLSSVIYTDARARPLPPITIQDERVFPESLSAARDGTIYIGSWKGIIYRAVPRSAIARAWIRPSPENGLLAVGGVLVDDKRHQLYVCSVPVPTRDPPAPGISALMVFDLRTAAQKITLPFPGPPSVCNDITLDKKGTAYVSDTPNGRIFRLRSGSVKLELFAQDERLLGIDGIVFDGAGTLFANSVSSNKLFRIGMSSAEDFTSVTEIAPSLPLQGPDGFRLIGGRRFVLAESQAKRIDLVEISGDHATVTVLKDGLVTPTAAITIGRTAFALERKIEYVRNPELRDRDPGPFIVHTIELPGR